VLGLWMLGVIVLLYIAHTALLRVETRMIYEASYDLRRRLYTHIHSQAFAFFQRHRIGELLHRVTADVRLFEDNAVELFSDLPFALLTIIGALTMMALMDLRLVGLPGPTATDAPQVHPGNWGPPHWPAPGDAERHSDCASV
jgi:ATP-binding cassette subfamily B multidrug efflux pump